MFPRALCLGTHTVEVTQAMMHACCLLTLLLLVLSPAPKEVSAHVQVDLSTSAAPGPHEPPYGAPHLQPAHAPMYVSPLPGSPDCGLTRTIRVRTLEGSAVAGVTVRLEARPPSSGGPETYGGRTGGCPADARPALTGTLTARTDAAGLARFERVGRGVWSVWLEGETGGRPIAPREAQGVPPYGTNPLGGGHIEMLDAFNEHVGKEPGAPAEPVWPLQLASTSSHVLLPTANGWVPALDLAEGSALPLPLSTLSPPSLSPPTPLTPLPAAPKVVETVGPSRDALLRGSPVVVGTVAPVAAGAAFPREGSTGAGSTRGSVWDKVLLVVGSAILGIGLLLWAASYARGRQKDQTEQMVWRTWRERRVRRGRGK